MVAGRWVKGLAWGALAVIVTVLIGHPPSLAQSLPAQIPSQAVPGRPPDRPASAPVTPSVELDFTLTAPQRTPGATASSGLIILISQVSLTGNTVFKIEDFEELTRDLVGRSVDANQLLVLAEGIETRYRDAGYILTRAFLPAQAVGDGRFTIQVVEGYISKAEVEGGGEARQAIVRSLIAPLVEKRPAYLPDLERALLLAGDVPGVTATGVLRPGEESGSSELLVQLAEKAMDAFVSLNNRGSRFTGPGTVVGDVTFYDSFGLGELISANVASTPQFRETRSVGLRWTQPTPWDGMTLSVEANYSNGRPGFTLREVEARTESYRYGVRASFPVVRARRENLTLDVAVATQKSSVNLLGQTFSRDDYRMLELRATWIDQGFLDGSTITTLGATQGLNLLGATQTGAATIGRQGANPGFTKFIGGVRRVQPLTDEFSLSVDLIAQYGFSTLFSAEQITFGGSRVGRGYEPAEYSGDAGVGIATELRWTASTGDDNIPFIQPYGFFDVGRVWNHPRSLGAPRSVTSAGGGTRFYLADGLTLQIEYAQGFVASPTNRERPRKLYTEFAIRF